MEEILLYFSLKYEGDFEKIYKALESKEKIDEEKKRILLKTVKSNNTTMISRDYPEALKHIPCPPFVLYYYGNISLLNYRNIDITGMNTSSDYGKEITEKFTKDLVNEKVFIISGLSYGIDTIAHQTAIENAGKTVAILGCGIDYCYPKNNTHMYQIIKNKHLLMSEYPGKTSPAPQNFIKRNRIIAGVSESVLVTETVAKSSSMITVNDAIEQGKDVYAIPGRLTDYQGTNLLIQQGAVLVTSVKDIRFQKEPYIEIVNHANFNYSDDEKEEENLDMSM